MKNKLQLIPACIAALALCAPVTAFAASKASPSPDAGAAKSPAAKAATSPAQKTSANAPAAAARALPFHGKISAVDQSAKTFTIAGKEKSRVFKVTDTSALSKGGAPATWKDVMANDEVRGSYWKAADGGLEVKTAKLGAVTEAEKAAAKPPSKKKQKAEKSTDAAPAAGASASPAASPKP